MFLLIRWRNHLHRLGDPADVDPVASLQRLVPWDLLHFNGLPRNRIQLALDLPYLGAMCLDLFPRFGLFQQTVSETFRPLQLV